MSLLSLLISFVRRKASASPPSPAEALRRSIVQRDRVLLRVAAELPRFRILLFVAGFAYLLLLPSSLLGTAHQVSENALQPAQVNTYWNWADVHVADNYANEMESWREQSTADRVESLKAAFESLGLPVASQSYSYALGRSNQNLTGTNVYSILAAPKTDGAEALVLSASWLSHAVDGEGRRRVNVRGVALVLALANYLKKYAMWSKDVIFLISDGYTEGTQAWLDSYHGFDHHNLDAEELVLTTGPIWSALNLDYPHHSFSHVGIYFEGANGHLPNLDLVNSASHILRHTGIPCLVAPAIDPPSMIDDLRPSRFAPNSVLTLLDARVAKEYERNTANLWRQMWNGASGRAGGPEGAFGRYRIDAMTLFGVPADGPHGFHSFGRATESILRSLNNLLERLHAAAFLYFMTSTDSFITVGSYLAAPILISAALTMLGLSICMDCFRAEDGAAGGGIVVCAKPRIGVATLIVGGSHLLGGVFYALISSVDPMQPLPTTIFVGTALVLIFAPHLVSLSTTTSTMISTATSDLVRSTTLILAGMTIAITSTLNFGLAVFVALVLFFPLYFSSRREQLWASEVQNALVVVLNPLVGWQIWRARDASLAESWMTQVLLEQAIGESWSVLIVAVVVMPLLLQTAIANVL